MSETKELSPDDPAVEGWTHAQMLNDGTELIVVGLKLHSPALEVRDLAIAEALASAHAVLTNRAGSPEITLQ